MKRIAIIPFVFLFQQVAFGQKALTLKDSITKYFQEIKAATKNSLKLWDKDLYGPILLVNPFTRQVYSNFPDSAELLKQDGPIFTGSLPNNIIVGNASIRWSGTDWAMILLPFITSNKQDRINLFAHELFHKAQPSLHLRPHEANNNHLDKKEGRIYLRLELEALKKAIQSVSTNAMKTHLTNALTFRKYRYTIFSGADTTENLLELNEGIAEYTGTVIAGRNEQETTAHFIKKINEFLLNPTYVRTFPYRTTPVYGYLLYQSDKNWNKQISFKSNLTDYFINAFQLSLPNDLKEGSEAIAGQYNGEEIRVQETEREEKTKKLVTEYKAKFIEEPHFEISFEKKSVSFDSRYVVPVEDKGIVYPTMKATDNWGTLIVECGGGLMSPNRDKVTVTVPIKMEGNDIRGDGWTLRLNDSYRIKKDEKTGNYTLVKK
jgi:hypothetical protein